MKLEHSALLHTQCYINGNWVDGANGTIAVDNPATGELIASVPNLGAKETRQAIDCAQAALPAWRARAAAERAALLMQWYQLIKSHRQDLARIMTAEQGKPLTEALGEVDYGASFVKWYAEEAVRVYGETIPAPRTDQRIWVIRQPVGVCALITPWNFPLAMITRKAAPALAAGCTLISRPASLTPLTALALAELAHQAGFPAGVFNVISGDSGPIGAELTSNEMVRKLSFTGSTAVGRKLLAQCAGSVKKVSMELGGNAPFIVFDDADLDAAVEGIMASKFRNTGQTCVCANRIYVQRSVYQEFADRLVGRVADLLVGPGDEAGVNQGPLINSDALEKVEEHIADATSKGAALLCGGKRHVRGGLFFEPSVLSHCRGDMLVAQEETFGPVAPLFAFEDETDVLTQANATEVGLAAYFYSRDMGRIMRIAEGLEVGMVGVNAGIISTAVAPFGGVKQSGIGREGGRQGLLEYLEEKYILLGGI